MGKITPEKRNSSRNDPMVEESSSFDEPRPMGLGQRDQGEQGAG